MNESCTHTHTRARAIVDAAGKVARLASQQWEKKKWEVGSWIGVDDVAEKLVAGNQQATKLAAAAAAHYYHCDEQLKQQQKVRADESGLPARRIRQLVGSSAQNL